MNLVGIHGSGESVWLGFFLYETLGRFVELAKFRNENELVLTLQAQAEKLAQNIEAHAWGGAWYTRAFFDDGSALGIAENQECRIDSLPQSWAVLSNVGSLERKRAAMESVYQLLVRKKESIVLVLDPPFDKSEPTPGYIAGYLPGVRENGGQYTHAALWVVMALAELGEFDRAMEILTLIDPVRRGGGNASIEHYSVEPYVVAADVYNNPQHVGRGGWTWYTGSAAWYYRVILETVLGFELRGDNLRFTSKIPSHWNEFRLNFTHKNSSYFVHLQHITDSEIAQTMWLDDTLVAGQSILLQDDGKVHHIKINISPSK
jgi:cellobiose phosphorylase